MATTTFPYRLFDQHCDPDIDQTASTHVVAQVLEEALKREGHDVQTIARPNGVYSEIEVRGLKIDGYEAWCLIDGIVTELPDEVWIMKEDARGS